MGLFYTVGHPMSSKLSFFLLLALAGCTQPADFNRDNPADPKSSTYVVAEPNALTLYPYGSIPRLTWGIGSILPEITIERKIGEDPWAGVATVPATDSLYLDDDIILYPPSTYRYRLHAHNRGQRSDTLTSWPIVVRPELDYPISSLPESFPSLRLHKQISEIQSAVRNDTVFVAIRLDTVQVERRIGDAPFEVVGTLHFNERFHDMNISATELQYRFTPKYMGQFQEESITTPILDRYQIISSAQNIHGTKMGKYDTWTAYETWNGLPYRPVVYRNTLTQWRMNVLRPNGTVVTTLSIRPDSTTSSPSVESTFYALSANRFAFVENSRRLVHFPFTGDPVANVEIIPNHQQWWDIAYNASGSVLYASYSDHLLAKHDIRSLTHPSETWETVLTLDKAAQWFAIDTLANRLHTIESFAGQQTWVTRQWNDGSVLYSVPIPSLVNQVTATSSGFLLLSGELSGNRCWIVKPGTEELDEYEFVDTHRFMVATSQPGVALRAVGDKLMGFDANHLTIDYTQFQISPTLGPRLNITSDEPTHLIEFHEGRTTRHIGDVARYRFRTTP
jgi:hypothetical protein